MIEIRKTDVFAKWLDDLCDVQARARLLARIDRLADGNPGDVKSVGSGISEMRIDYGAGYRVYYVARGRELIILFGWWRQGQPVQGYQNINSACTKFVGAYYGQDQNNPLRCR